MEYEVLVQLKGEVLDPEGRAIQEALKSQGVQGVAAVQVAKRFVLSFDPAQLKSPDDADAAVRSIAERYLANPVAQTFTVKRLS